jgi:anti-sigma B factor antagonist
MSLEANVRRSGDITVVDLQGAITLSDGAEKLRETMKGVLGKGSKRIVLNMAGVTFIDSAGLGEMVGSHAASIQNGGRLKLAALPARLQGLLRMTRLEAIFESFPDETSAIRSF